LGGPCRASTWYRPGRLTAVGGGFQLGRGAPCRPDGAAGGGFGHIESAVCGTLEGGGERVGDSSGGGGGGGGGGGRTGVAVAVVRVWRWPSQGVWRWRSCGCGSGGRAAPWPCGGPHSDSHTSGGTPTVRCPAVPWRAGVEFDTAAGSTDAAGAVAPRPARWRSPTVGSGAAVGRWDWGPCLHWGRPLGGGTLRGESMGWVGGIRTGWRGVCGPPTQPSPVAVLPMRGLARTPIPPACRAGAVCAAACALTGGLGCESTHRQGHDISRTDHRATP